MTRADRNTVAVSMFISPGHAAELVGETVLADVLARGLVEYADHGYGYGQYVKPTLAGHRLLHDTDSEVQS